jgi:uncharacterized protein
MIGEIKRALRYRAIRLLRMKDSKEKLARGFAIGMVFNFLPTFGFGAFISGFVARLFGGNIVAGFIGGSTLAIFWPILFYLNIRVGSLFLRPAVVVDDMGDVTPQTINALVWGQTFALGALLNSMVFGLAAYFIFLLAYERIKLPALDWLQQRSRVRSSFLSQKRAGR